MPILMPVLRPALVSAALLLSTAQAATESASPVAQTGTQTGTQAAQTSTQTALSSQKAQVPGYYRIKLGNFQVIALYDGYTKLPPELFQGLQPQQITQLLQQKFIDSTDGIQTAVNAFLIDTGKQLILVDSGAAKCLGDNLGSIEDNMRAAGYQPAQVNAVLLTHLHPDHVCGITQQPSGEKAFAKATVYVNKTEADFWLDSKQISKYSPSKQEKFKGAFALVAQVLKPYQASKQYQSYTVGSNIADGIEVVQTPGHTVGHTSYLVSSGDQKLLILGDVVHNHAIQFQQPQVSVDFDFDEKQAVASRLAAFSQAAKQGYLIAGAHLPFPGLGHVYQANNQQFQWVPVEYAPLPKQ